MPSPRPTPLPPGPSVRSRAASRDSVVPGRVRPPTPVRALSASHRKTELYEGIDQDLIDELGRLPGVGPKGAQRIAFHLLAADPTHVSRLVAALSEVKDKGRV